MNRYADFRILIVDDNQNNLFTLRALIEKHMDVELLEARPFSPPLKLNSPSSGGAKRIV